VDGVKVGERVQVLADSGDASVSAQPSASSSER